jgi:formylglycine-generating enzyme required for sulfatase activity
MNTDNPELPADGVPDDAQEQNLAIETTAFKRADSGTAKRRFILRPIPILITSLFILLGIAALFLFSARAVKFDVVPAPDTIEITSGYPTYRLGERFLMLSGSYEIAVTAAGYHDLRAEVDIGDEQDQNIPLAMQKLPGILLVHSEPVDQVEVFIDQQSYGFTPLTVDQIEPGLHDIQFVSKRYLAYQTEVEIEGRRQEQSVTAELSPAWANVSIASNPAAASILIDDEVVGESSSVVEVLQGTHTVGLKKPGYKLWQSDLVVSAGEELTLDPVDLVKSDGKLSINSDPAGVNVTIAERYYGQTPLSVSLAPGSAYEMLLSKAGFEPVRRTLRIAAEEDIAMNLKLTPVTGVIRLQVQPSDSELFVDGRAMDGTSQRLTLTATRHRIEVKKAGYAPYSTVVTPQPGLTQQLMISLQTEEQARAAAIADIVTPLENVSLKLVLPDKLTMGAGRREPGRRSNEIQKDVLLTRAFYLGTHEITNKAYKAHNPAHESGILGRSLLGDDDRPVVNISWDDAVRFCNWLSQKNGLPVAYQQTGGSWSLIQPVNTGFRLPTEAEWAWAARYHNGNEPSRFPWGNDMPPSSVDANYADESAANTVPYHVVGYNDTYRGSSPVGTFSANNFGIFDLAGNVSEWVTDFYGVGTSRTTLTDPVGPESGDFHVIRGSNYMHGRFSELRWTFRDYGTDPRPDVGFRIARYVE